MKKIFSLLLAIIICMSFVACSGNNSFSNAREKIMMVKTGSPFSYPDITYEEAFNNFFRNPSWEYFEDENKIEMVGFKGECLYDDVEIEVYIKFALDIENGTSEITDLSFNNIRQEYDMLVDLIETVFSDEELY